MDSIKLQAFHVGMQKFQGVENKNYDGSLADKIKTSPVDTKSLKPISVIDAAKQAGIVETQGFRRKLRLRMAWCQNLLIQALTEGLNQIRKNMTVNITGPCARVNQAVRSWIEINKNKIPVTGDVYNLATQYVTFFPMDQGCSCLCEPPVKVQGIGKFNGTLGIMPGMIVDDFNAIRQEFSKDAFLCTLLDKGKESLVRDIIIDRTLMIEGVKCRNYFFVQPELIALSRYWLFQRINNSKGLDTETLGKKLLDAKVLSLVNEAVIDKRFQSFQAEIEGLGSEKEVRAKIDNFIVDCFIICGGQISEAKKLAKLISGILIAGSSAPVKIIVTNDVLRVQKFLKIIFSLVVDNKPKNLSCCLFPKQEAVVLRRPNGDVYHFTEYSVAQLNDPSKLSRFQQESLYGHILNVTTVDRQIDIADGSFLDQVFKGAEVTYNHHYFGKETFTPTGSYVFVTDCQRKDYFKGQVKETDYEVFHIDHVLNGELLDLNLESVKFIFTKFAWWGHQFSRNSEDVNSSLDPVDTFIDKCVDKVEFETLEVKGEMQPVIDEKTSTSLMTLKAAFKRFKRLLSIKSKDQLSEKLFNDKGFMTRTTKCDDVAKRDTATERGYDIVEVLKPGSHTVFVAGCIVKSTFDIERIANDILTKVDSDGVTLSIDEFCDVLMGEVLK